MIRQAERKNVFYGAEVTAGRPESWRTAIMLAVLLEALWLMLMAGQAAMQPSAALSMAEAGSGDDLSVALLANAGDIGRTARFVPAAVSEPAVDAPAKPVAAPAPVAVTTQAFAPVATPVLTTVTPPTGENSVAAQPTAAPNAVAGAAAADVGGSGSIAAQGATPGLAGGSGQPAAGVVANSGSQGTGSGIGSRHARHPYFGKLKAWLNAHKTYPAALKKAKTQGTVVLTFTISRSGELLSSRIVIGSGEPGLDQAALDMLQRSSPMPPLPDELGLDKLTLTIPVEYSLITR
ncbi:MAG TPA: energy transducer TonB [Fluviicoccus sp.]|nr:energy transducer TonB [Fluviicoccus sp.]